MGSVNEYSTDIDIPIYILLQGYFISKVGFKLNKKNINAFWKFITINKFGCYRCEDIQSNQINAIFHYVGRKSQFEHFIFPFSLNFPTFSLQ